MRHLAVTTSIVVAAGVLIPACGPSAPITDPPPAPTLEISSFAVEPDRGEVPLAVTVTWTLDLSGDATLECELEVHGPDAATVAIDPCPTEGEVEHTITEPGTHSITLHAAYGPATGEAAAAVFVETPAATTERVSVHTDGSLANGRSGAPALSHDAEVVAFESDAANLVPGDTNGVTDVFVRDRTQGTTERVSVASDGTQGDGPSSAPSISADGRYVAFVSSATELVPGDTNGVDDVFVHDRDTGVTERVSVASDGTEADAASHAPHISHDGRHVMFTSDATTLSPEGAPGLFVHDRAEGTTVLVPVDVGVGPWATSADTAFVTFRDGPDVLVYDRLAEASWTATTPPGGGSPSHDSVPWSVSVQGDTAFHTLAANLLPDADTDTWQVAVHDVASGMIDLVSVRADGGGGGNERSFSPVVDPTGRYVLFLSLADDLVPGTTHVGWSLFLRDRVVGTTQRVPVSSGPAQQPAYEHALSGSGRRVAFSAVAGAVVEGVEAGAELVPPHPDGVQEVFLHTVE